MWLQVSLKGNDVHQTRCSRNRILSLMVADEIAQHESQRKHNDKSNKTPSCFKEEWLDQVVEIGDDGHRMVTKQ